MEQRIMRKILQIDGMTCTSCEMRIEKALKKLDGVIEVKAIFSSSNVYVTYDENAIKLAQIIEVIEELDYVVRNKPDKGTAVKQDTKKASEAKMTINQLLGTGIILFAFYIIVNNTVGFNFISEINQSMGYGILFVVGLLTSLHCVAMCGGINLSLCVSNRNGNTVSNGTDEGVLNIADGGSSSGADDNVSYANHALNADGVGETDGLSGSKTGWFQRLKPSLLYNGGRVVSYTVIGGLVGALGSGINFSGSARGIVAVIAGVFMVIMGLNMLNIFPWLRKLNPRMPKIFGSKIHNSDGRYGPFIVGIFNGLMPCGPLQAMQIYALGTGSFTAGALSMFMFSLGTVPLMFGFGAVSSILSRKFTHKMMKVSAVLVIALGVIMANRGLALSGISLPSLPFGAGSVTQGGSNIATVKDGVQTVTTKLYPGRYEPITVQKGIPVRWVIKASKRDINGCNNEIVIPGFNMSKKLEPGDNIIEFTPTETDVFAYSCWMGMIRSKITVVDDINNVNVSGTGYGVQKSDYRTPTVEIALQR